MSRPLAAALLALLCLTTRPTAAEDPPYTAAERSQALQRSMRLDLEVRRLVQAGQHAQALPLARESLAIGERFMSPTDLGIQLKLVSLGNVLSQLGLFAEARVALDRAMTLVDRNGPSSTTTAAAGLKALGDVLRGLGERSAARERLTRALSIAAQLKVGGNLLLLPILDSLGALESDAEEWDAAYGYYARAVDLLAPPPGGDPRVRAHLLTALGRTVAHRGDTQQALGLFAQARDELRAAPDGGGPWLAETLAAWGDLCFEQGDYAAARQQLEAALRLREGDAWTQPQARSLNSLAIACYHQGQLDQAREFAEQAVMVTETLLGAQHSDTARCLTTLASVLTGLGRPQSALPVAERAAAILSSTHGTSHLQTGAALRNLASARRQAGDPEGGRRDLERALAVAESHGDAGLLLASECLGDLGTSLVESDDAAAGLPLLRRSLALKERLLGPEHPDVAPSLGNTALALEALGKPEAARPLLDRALSITRATRVVDHPHGAILLRRLARLELAQGRVAGAREMFQEAMLTVERYVLSMLGAAQGRERIEIVQLAREHLDYFQAEVGGLGIDGYAEALRLKGLVARREAVEHQILLDAPAGYQAQLTALAAAERDFAKVAHAMPRASQATARLAWQTRYAAARAQVDVLRRPVEREAATRMGPAATPPDVQRSLPPDTVLLDVLRSGPVYLAWIVRSTGPVERLVLGPAEIIEAECREFTRAQADAGAAGDGGAAGASLSRRLLAPIWARHGEGLRRLVVSPDGALAAVPLGALPGRQPGRLLWDELDVSLAGMAQHLIASGVAPERNGASLVLGNVDFDSAGGPAAGQGTKERSRAPQFAPLPGTALEIAALRPLLGAGTTVLEGSLATEAQLREHAAHRRVLHLATHGFVRDEMPSALGPSGRPSAARDALTTVRLTGQDPLVLCGLALAGANPRRGGGDDDGLFTALEAGQLDLRECGLVVLSACETARGKVEAGEGVLGLVRSFQSAGARNVVASLWRVDDDATRLLMQRFYELLLRRDDPPATSRALREAALWLRASRPEGRDLSHPKYWAAFGAYERR